jgi:hypothetical protein
MSQKRRAVHGGESAAPALQAATGRAPIEARGRMQAINPG